MIDEMIIKLDFLSPCE